MNLGQNASPGDINPTNCAPWALYCTWHASLTLSTSAETESDDNPDLAAEVPGSPGQLTPHLSPPFVPCLSQRHLILRGRDSQGRAATS